MTTIPENAKQPADRLPAAQPTPPVELTPGWDLLKPLAELPAWDLLDIYAELMELWDAMDSATGQAGQLRAMAALTKKLLTVAVDEAAYTTFASGKDGLSDAVNLAGAWMAELGKSVGSAS